MKALDLTQGPITRTLIAFTLPALGSNVLQSLNASVNAIWVGHFLGEAPLTAATNANMALFLPEGSAALPIAEHANVIALWSFLLFGVTIVLISTVRATGAVMGPLLVIFGSLWLARIQFAYSLAPRWARMRSGGASPWAPSWASRWDGSITATATGAKSSS